uniref:Arrestin C-terminal-like domain-containing protein n=1 Tax=Neogobius melanostomus TaxID=47308 RepID=A0A8C6TXR7_9GOBI
MTLFSFSVGYNPINESNVFSSGDYISGQVTVELTKDTDVNALSVKMKGKAEVRWTENHGRNSQTYFSKEKYFSVKQFLIQEGQVSQGCNVYPFTFQIPAQNMPSSFKGAHGKIRYTLEANLSRSMRMDSKAKAEFNLVSKSDLAIQSSLGIPQHGATDKKMKLFNSGYVAMDVHIDKSGFHQGEGIKVVASIHNKSSRDVCPKYCVYRKCSFFAKGKRKLDTYELLKEVGVAVPPSAGQTVTKFITIPAATIPSISNCNIIKVEYRLRVCTASHVLILSRRFILMLKYIAFTGVSGCQVCT